MQWISGQFTTQSTPGCLSCVEYRTFWIGWSRNEIAVGRDSVIGENSFMSWTNPNPFPINYMFVSLDHGATGDWVIFDCRQGTIIIIYSFIFTPIAEKHNKIQIDIQLCNTVWYI